MGLTAGRFLLLLVLAGASPAHAARAQSGPAGAARPASRLLRGYVGASLRADTGAVLVDATFVVSPEGAAALPVAVVLFGPAMVADVRASADGRPLAVSLVRGEGPRLAGSIALPPDLRLADSLNIAVRYTVLRAAEADGRGRRVRIPVVAPLWPPVHPRPDTFVGEARLPADMAAYEMFPTPMKQIADSAGRRTYRVTLQVVPALLSFRTVPGERPLLTMPHVLDAVMLSAIGLFTLFGWRYLQRGTA